jgi:hypothetical protein
MFKTYRRMGDNKMIKTMITVVFVWIIIAFTWDPFVAIVEKTQAVDKTKEIVYNVINNVKEKVDE